jgi:hypothetical protein
MKIKPDLTTKQVKHWLGSDASKDDLIEIIRDVANGTYPAHLLADDIYGYIDGEDV